MLLLINITLKKINILEYDFGERVIKKRTVCRLSMERVLDALLLAALLFAARVNKISADKPFP